MRGQRRKKPMSLKPKAKTKVDKDMIDGVWSDNLFIQFKYASKFRDFLSHEKDPPIDEIVESGVVPRFVEFLKKEDFFAIQFSAACVLRIISEEDTKVLIDHGAVQILVHLLAGATDNVLIQNQARWTLGNIALDSIQSRDYVLRCGALSPLLAQMLENTEMLVLRPTAWTLLHFCSGQPRPPFRQMKPALSALKRVLHRNDEDFLSNDCWTLIFLYDGSKEFIQSVIDADLVPRLVQLLRYSSPSVIGPAMFFIMNLTNGDNQQTKFVIDHGVVPRLAYLLTQDYVTIWNYIKRDACWTISNITAGTEEQIQSVIDANLIPTLVDLAHNAEFDIKEKAVWAISNVTSGGSHDQIKYLVKQGCIEPLCDLLVCPDVRIISESLVSLENILKVAEAERNIGHGNYYCQLVENAEGLEKIEKLQHHVSNKIYQKALKFLETYWEEEDDEQTQQRHWSVN